MNITEYLLVCLIEEIKEVEIEIRNEKINLNNFIKEMNDIFGVATLINLDTTIDFEFKQSDDVNMETFQNNIKYLNIILDKLFYFSTKSLRFGLDGFHRGINKHGNHKEEIEYYLKKLNVVTNYFKCNNIDIYSEFLINKKIKKIKRFLVINE